MRKHTVQFILNYFIFASYFYVLPILIQMNDILRFVHLVMFFPLAFFLTKKWSGKGLDSYGIVFFQGWQRNLMLGFLIGAAGWALLFFLRIVLGDYHITGIKSGVEAAPILVVVFVGYGLGSIINDVIVRGLVFHFYRNRLSFKALMLLSVVVYAADDSWNEGFSISNTFFSVALGFSLAYAFYKTHSIWADTGIHLGLNVIYGLFYGVSGNRGDGIFLFQVHSSSNLLLGSWLSTITAALIFLALYLFIHSFRIPSKIEPLTNRIEKSAI
ncbi:CPBP family intramembrane glutamic endopeptidase [Peribacillus deserti]|uniref:CAAX prenyl protease 2/Lysostaphin resistance protein A-like domain-containing protein n=1 Tax=Peribacillus deserti TaxID=673318 RepID=A0A2N5M7A5_9BACI|nr:CPBP family intramembrane glutamic endopeptidase [Peribacillus deserti]PLT30258.1 hypothetical protein CUU66_08525 [Peribacillus deserti]